MRLSEKFFGVLFENTFFAYKEEKRIKDACFEKN